MKFRKQLKFMKVIKALYSVLLILFLPVAFFSQQISSMERSDILKEIKQVIKERYVLEDVASQIVEGLNQNKYEENDTAKFLQQLNKDLRSLSQDKHLEIYQNPDFGKDPTAPKSDKDKKQNYGFSKVEILKGNIGYLKINYFAYPKEAASVAKSSMNFLTNADAIVIDLRENKGGSKAMVQLLASYFFDDEPIHLYSIYGRDGQYFHGYTEAAVEGSRMPKTPLFIICDKRTFSAAEMFAFVMKNAKGAIVIGENTAGGGHTVSSQTIGNGKFILNLPVGQVLDPKTKKGWEKTGIQPDTAISGDLAYEKAYFEALKQKMNNSEKPSDLAVIKWQSEILQTKLEPKKVDAEILKSYAGKYERRIITFKDGVLWYQAREGSEPAKLIPIDERYFRFDEVDYFRVRFEKDTNGNVIGLKGVFDDGFEDYTKRN